MADETTTPQHVMHMMGAAGDTTITWDVENEDEVEAAEKMWEDLVGERRYLAYRTNAAGKRGEQMHEFDPDAERIVICPPMAGGRG